MGFKEVEAKRKKEDEDAQKLSENPDAIVYQRPKEEREILNELTKHGEAAKQHDAEFDMLHVSNQQPGFHYCWVYTGSSGALINQFKFMGFEFVSGNMPEAIEHKDPTSTGRRMADAVLMRIPVSKYEKLLKKDEERAAAYDSPSMDDLRSRAHRTNGRINVYGLEEAPDRIFSADKKRGAMMTAAVRKIALDIVNEKIRTGTLPGMPIGGHK